VQARHVPSPVIAIRFATRRVCELAHTIAIESSTTSNAGGIRAESSFAVSLNVAATAAEMSSSQQAIDSIVYRARTRDYSWEIYIADYESEMEFDPPEDESLPPAPPPNTPVPSPPSSPPPSPKVNGIR
jgi:hypothetical protein